MSKTSKKLKRQNRKFKEVKILKLQMEKNRF